MNSLFAFNLGNDVDIRIPGFQQAPDGDHVRRLAHEGSSDKVNLVIDPEVDIGNVLVGHRRQVQVHPRQADPFLVGQFTTIHHLAQDIPVADFQHLEPDIAIVQKNAIARQHGLRQAFVGDGDPALVTLDLLGSQSHPGAIPKVDPASL